MLQYKPEPLRYDMDAIEMPEASNTPIDPENVHG